MGGKRASVRAPALVLIGLLLAGCTGASSPPDVSTSSEPPTPTNTLNAGPSAPGSASAQATTGGGPGASLVVTGGEQLTLSLPKVKCELTKESDGSAAVDLVFTLRGQPEWEFDVGASSEAGHAFDHAITISTAAHSISDPYSGVANFLDSNGSTGSGWTVGGPHGVLLPGTISINADLSGSIDAPLRRGQPSDSLADIHIKGHWTC